MSDFSRENFFCGPVPLVKNQLRAVPHFPLFIQEFKEKLSLELVSSIRLIKQLGVENKRIKGELMVSLGGTASESFGTFGSLYTGALQSF